MTDERYARTRELTKLPKWQLIKMVRAYWGGGNVPPERWTKEELAGGIAAHEEDIEKYAAYGNVPLLNGLPMDHTRPHCGAQECPGHSCPALPWEDVRDRYREGGPCVGPLPEPMGPTEACGRFLQDHLAACIHPNTHMRFQAGDSHRLVRKRRPDGSVDETIWWTSEGPDSFYVPNAMVDVAYMLTDLPKETRR